VRSRECVACVAHASALRALLTRAACFMLGLHAELVCGWAGVRVRVGRCTHVHACMRGNLHGMHASTPSTRELLPVHERQSMQLARYACQHCTRTNSRVLGVLACIPCKLPRMHTVQVAWTASRVLGVTLVYWECPSTRDLVLVQ
jgi:hypothetical protein